MHKNEDKYYDGFAGIAGIVSRNGCEKQIQGGPGSRPAVFASATVEAACGSARELQVSSHDDTMETYA